MFSMNDNVIEKIRQYREVKGWSQEQLARNLGVSLNTVQRWELRKSRPSPLAMEKVKELLGDSLESNQIRLL